MSGVFMVGVLMQAGVKRAFFCFGVAWPYGSMDRTVKHIDENL
ncbi:hypothetical protein [Cardinium endosymbiont of Dermatophagoides farinae]|nr:hypothetical protein [Cardinium endosymbiont of Dermatophagoides farinae]